MKKMKKFLSMLVAATMTLAMAAPSFAANEGSITIKNATLGQSYSVYKLFDANPNTSNTNQVAYTIEADKVSNIKNFTATVVEVEGETETTRTISNPFDFGDVGGNNNIKNVSLSEGVQEADVLVFLQQLFDSNLKSSLFAQQGDTWVANEVSHIFDNLPLGYYFVDSTVNSVVSITTTTPRAEIIDKNQDGPHWNPDPEEGGKKIVIPAAENGGAEGFVSETDANYGDILQFQLKLDTTNYKSVEEVTSYQLTDQLGDGLSYVLNGENNEGNEPTDVKIDSVSIISGTTTYAVTKDDYTVTMSEGGKGFEISFPWKSGEDFRYGSPATITVRYSATVTDTADVNTALTNTANFGYNNHTKAPETETGTETYTYALAINKITEEGKGLADAEFGLTLNGQTVYVTPIMEGEGEDAQVVPGQYKWSATATDTVIKSPASGLIIIKGLEEGTYTLTETKAPAGYNRYEKTLNAIINGEKDADGRPTENNKNTRGITVWTLTKNNVTEVVEAGTPNADSRSVDFPVSATPFENVINVAGTRLPSTGGIGTTIFYAAGIILMAGAVFFVVRRKRA